MKGLSTEIRRIVDSTLAEGTSRIGRKPDRSWVTDLDLAVEHKLRSHLVERFPSLLQVGEEDESTHREKYDFSGDYLLIDPIDGTENFIAGNGLFGSVLSMRVGDDELHMIYLPGQGLIIASDDLPTSELRSDIVLCSTKCMKQAWPEVDSFRVIGSSAVMFAMLLQGQAQRYRYCVGAKIWDCYTGIRLALMMGLDVRLTGHDIASWVEAPPHITEFDISWTH